MLVVYSIVILNWSL